MNRRILFAMAIVGTVLLGCGTKEPTKHNRDEFVIEVDSVSFPDSVAWGEKVYLKFFYTEAASSDCRFDHFSVRNDSLATQITLVGSCKKNNSYKGSDEGKVMMQETHLSINDSTQLRIQVINPGYNRLLERNLIIR